MFMRINEFTDAKEQLALLRLIVDNTWSAIAQQAKAQDAQKAATASTAKAIKKPAKAALKIAAKLGAKAKQNTVQQQHQVKQPVQQVQQVPRQPLQQPSLSNSIKAVSTTQTCPLLTTQTCSPKLPLYPLKNSRAKNSVQVLTLSKCFFTLSTPCYLAPLKRFYRANNALKCMGI